LRPASVLAWVVFLLYALWAGAAQGWLAGPTRLGEWTPDLGLVLLFAAAGRLRGARGASAALLVAAGRAASSSEPSALLAANALGALGGFAYLARTFAVERALPRAMLCGLSAWGTAALLVAARERVLAAEAPSVGIEGLRLWPAALVTAAACLVLGPLVARLPGVAVLTKAPR
jgi:hypothetical protein